MGCKVCGSKGPMKLNVKGRESDTCLVCHKKYKRLQHLHYTLPIEKIKDHQVIEHNALAKELAAKTKVPLIIPGPSASGWVLAEKVYEPTNVVNTPQASSMADKAFELYMQAVPRKVLFNQDKLFGGASNESNRLSMKEQYEGTIQYLFDTMSAVARGERVAVYDKDLWSGNLGGFAMDNEEILQMENVEPEHMYHWLCFVSYTLEDTIKDGESIQGNVEDYLKYSINPMDYTINVTE